MNKLNKALSIFLIVVIVTVLGFIVYLVTTPQQNEKFTEFYILSLDGKAAGYPQEATVDKPAQLIMGITNHEDQAMDYRVEIKIEGTTINKLNIGSLDNDQKWEQVINFTPKVPGAKQKVEFYLYKNNDPQPYLKDPLRLYIDVY